MQNREKNSTELTAEQSLLEITKSLLGIIPSTELEELLHEMFGWYLEGVVPNSVPENLGEHFFQMRALVSHYQKMEKIIKKQKAA